MSNGVTRARVVDPWSRQLYRTLDLQTVELHASFTRELTVK